MKQMIVASDRQVTVGIFDKFQSALIVDIGWVGESGACLQIALKLVVTLDSIYELSKFLYVKIGQTSLLF